MSRFYRKKNSESTKDLFEKKLIYDLKTKRTSNSNALVDFEFAEKALYGRVNRLYLPIKIKNQEIPLKSIKSATDPNGLKVLNFVSDAFEALCKNFQKKEMLNQISKEEKFLTNLQAHKAYVPYGKAYNNHIDSYISAFKNIAKQNNIKFADFDQFMVRMMPYLLDASRKEAFTLPAFMKSKDCPIFCSGLAIKVSNIPYSDNVSKVNNFLESKNWQYYVNACQSYGFSIDKNNPDTLVADIGSAEMLAFAEPYGIMSTDAVLAAGYTPAHMNYLENFKNILYRLYMELKVKRYQVYTEITPDKSKNTIIKPRNYTYGEFSTYYGDSYFIKLYCKIRFQEEESEFTEQEMSSLIDNTIELSRKNLDQALNSFELIINKTFDYRGSLSYHKARVTKLGR